MAMGTRKQREKQEDLWIAHTELATAPGHPFYQKLNELLEDEGFDERPSLTPGIYFRSLLIGYFEGIGAERGIAWRLADCWRCGVLWALRWTSTRRITRRFRARED
jgi:transposase